MPVCFQLCHKDRPTTPVSFIEIDEAMCKALGQQADPVRYLWEWYDSIGLRLALGRSFNEIIVDYTQRRESEEGQVPGAAEYLDHMIQVAEWLSLNYVSDSWREVGRA